MIYIHPNIQLIHFAKYILLLEILFKNEDIILKEPYFD